MKNHIVFKFLAVVICALALLVSLASGVGVVALAEAGLYESTLEQLMQQNTEVHLQRIAQNLAEQYAGTNLSNCSQAFMDVYSPIDQLAGTWCYTLKDVDGKLLVDTRTASIVTGSSSHEFLVKPHYPVILEYEVYDNNGRIDHSTTSTGVIVPQPTEATYPPNVILPGTVMPSSEESDYLYIENFGYSKDGNDYLVEFGILEGPVYLVTLYVQPDAAPQGWEDEWALAQLGYQHRFNLLILTGVGLLLFAITLVYLCCAAGKKPKCSEIQPGGLNLLPLDLYSLIVCCVTFFAAVVCLDLLRWNLDYYSVWLILLAVAGISYVICLLAVGFLFACAAQFKMRKGYWWRHSIIGATLLGIIRLLKAILQRLKRFGNTLRQNVPSEASKAVTNTGNIFKKLAQIGKQILLSCWAILTAILTTAGKCIRACWHFLRKIFYAFWRSFIRFWGRLPLTWQWLLTGFLMVFVLSVSLSSPDREHILIGVGICIAIILYGAHCFGTLLESTKRMSQGDLDTKVDDKLLIGSFEEYATHLNSLAGVAEQAARDKMKSERMKAELITNVSHDIKTPLTSIINYVDLLQKTDSQEDARQYLEVLDRQSHRLKKLIDDLMEMSKASTGNMHVDIQRVNAVEAINQALGEFSEKLEQVELSPIFNPPEEPLYIHADGRLTWRVLSNLLSNAVKYALPGTRLYIDLVRLDDRVLISLKNISKEQLNVSSEELMERFVRGDASRNTEGSGLGLNIAKSLMDLQMGQLQLLVDGDLFKATLIFPSA